MIDRQLAMARLWELATLLGEDMASGLARDGLTRARAEVLMVLRRLGPCTQRALAEALRVSPRNITGLVDALVSTGYVTREPHPDDRRATLVTPTAYGRETIQRFDDSGRAFADRLLADLSADRVDAFVTDLEAVLGRLRAEMDRPAPPPVVMPD